MQPRPRTRWWPLPLTLGVLAFGAVFTLFRGQSDTPRAVVPRTVIAPTILRAENQAAVRWHQDTVDVVLDSSLDAISSSSAATFGRALNAWRASDANLPSVSTVRADGANSHKVGYDAAGANQNLVIYAKYGWAPAHGALAVTVLTYDTATGKILDADIVLNGGGRFFAELAAEGSRGSGDPVLIEPAEQAGAVKSGSGSDSDVDTRQDALTDSLSSNTVANQVNQGSRYDLENILTHELGHLFGLGEDYDNARSAMYGTTRAGETTKRVIDAVDATSLQQVYSGELSDPSTIRGCGGAQIAAGPAGAARSQSGVACGIVALASVLRRVRRSGKGEVPGCVPDDRSSRPQRCRTSYQVSSCCTGHRHAVREPRPRSTPRSP